LPFLFQTELFLCFEVPIIKSSQLPSYYVIIVLLPLFQHILHIPTSKIIGNYYQLNDLGSRDVQNAIIPEIFPAYSYAGIIAIKSTE